MGPTVRARALAETGTARLVSQAWAGHNRAMTNTLYYGDNLEVLREHIADASVDLIYLDPPFKSNACYNVLFRAPSGGGHRPLHHALARAVTLCCGLLRKWQTPQATVGRVARLDPPPNSP